MLPLSLSVRRSLVGLPLVALSAGLLAPPAALADTAPGSPPDRAAAWLAGQLSAAGTVVDSYPDANGDPVPYTDWGRSLDAAIALLATGTEPNVLGRTVFSVEQPAAVAEYTQGVPFDRADAAYVGATAKLAFVVELAGGDATATGGVDLLAQLQSLATEQDRFADRSDFGDFANLYGHAFALLAQDAAGTQVPQAQVDALLAAQCADGGFPQEYDAAEGAACESQVDATGLVLQALAALDLAGGADAQEALAWLDGQQQEDGSFPGEVPVNSTGYAAAGLLAVDSDSADAAAARQWLAGQQNADGGLPRGTGDDASSDVFATAQALPALLGTPFAAVARDVVRRPVAASIDPLCTEAPDSAFEDVEGNAHEAAIECLAWLGVAEGRSDREYAPAPEVTREQMASFLARTLRTAGVAVPDDAPQRFEDVPAGSTHSSAINGLAELGVVGGTSATTYSPTAPVTRAQMAAFLARAYDAAADLPLPTATAPYGDVSGTHAADIGRISDAGITTGVTADRYAPGRSVTRDAMASFLARTLNLLLVAGAPVDVPTEGDAGA